MTLRRLSQYGVAILGLVALLTASMLWLRQGDPGPSQRILGMTLVSLLAATWAVMFAVRLFRRQDEFGRAGSRFAWYWGGAFGLLATLPAYVFIGMGGLHWLNPQIPAGPELFRAFQLGYGLAVGGLAAGMMVAGGIWWLRHR
jgi:hypothetical protein